MRIRQSMVAVVLAAALVPGGDFSGLLAQERTGASRAASADDLDTSHSEMRPLIERFTDDRASLTRTYPLRLSSTRSARLKQLYTEWRDRIGGLAFDSMGADGRV